MSWGQVSPNGAAILANSNMAAIQLDVNHRYRGHPQILSNN